MKAKWIGLATGVFALALTAAPAAAHMHGHHCGGAVGISMPLVLHSANLTSAQRQQIHTIMHSQFATFKPLFQQLRAGREAVATKYLSAGSVTAAELTPLVTANEQIQSQIDQAFLQTAIQIRGVLSAAQLAQAGSTYTQMQALHQQMHALMSAGQDGPPPADD
ncbi:MAG TPA: periplasmic heavy metal sensor [Candidatus Binataceae bacterium]|nr:periplasmic heavy metal sensor [Candidatus Binataceae bacterium]